MLSLSRATVHGIATGNNLTFTVQWKRAQILAPGRLNSVRCGPIFVGPKVGTRSVSFSEMGTGIFGKSVQPCSRSDGGLAATGRKQSERRNTTEETSAVPPPHP